MKKIQLSIPTPCHENWQGMTPNEQGRFCSSCQKTVVDFTNMTDSQIITFFKEPKASVCGRLHPDQMDRDIVQPAKRLPWIRHFFTMAIPAFLWSLKSSGQTTRIGRVAPVASCAPAFKGDTIITPATKITDPGRSLQGMAGELMIRTETISEITGQVIDTEGQPLPYASVQLKGEKRYVQADSTGKFFLKGKHLRGKVLVVSYVGFQSAEAIVSSSFISVTLSRPLYLGEVVTSGAIVRKAPKRIPLMKQLIDTAFSRFSIYPNPASNHSILTIHTQKLEKGTYVISLINSGGEVVYNEQKKIEAKEQRLTLSLQSMAAGTYYVSFFNTKTAKSYSEKLIVE